MDETNAMTSLFESSQPDTKRLLTELFYLVRTTP